MLQGKQEQEVVVQVQPEAGSPHVRGWRDGETAEDYQGALEVGGPEILVLCLICLVAHDGRSLRTFLRPCVPATVRSFSKKTKWRVLAERGL